MQQEKGSITVFSLLSLLLITAALFALLEGTRLQEMQRLADLQTEIALESGFACYNTCLWKNYHLLGTGQEEMEQQLEQIANGRVGHGTNLFRMKVEEISLEEYVLLTDADGRVFIRSAATYMRDNWVYEAAKEIYSQYEAIKYLMESSQMDETDIGKALQEMENAQKANSQKAIRNRTSQTQTPIPSLELDVRELLELAKSWKEYGILELVIKEKEKISQSQPDFSNSLLKRDRNEGTNLEQEPINWQERVLFQQYLLTYMSYFQGEKEGRALSYELEYLIGEKSSDIENLKAVATKLLAIREAVNFIYLLSNPVKMAQAESVATLIAGASLNTVLIEAVKVGILTAWALAESILDVRALLSGKRIPLLKSDETWTTELAKLSEIMEGYPMAKESTWGLNYENYLGVLLLMEKEEEVAMRAMNAQEATVRMTYEDDAFGIDTLLVNTKVKIAYSYKPVFPFLQVIDAENQWEPRVWGRKSYGYY